MQVVRTAVWTSRATGHRQRVAAITSPTLTPPNRAMVAMAKILLAMAVFVCVALPGQARAQAYGYPSMQTPIVSVRDYTAAVTAANGTSLLFQWREQVRSNAHLSLDVGLGDPYRGNGLILFAAGGLGRQLARSTATQPLDLLFTAGAGVALGGGITLLRVPVGVSVGHRFELQDNFAITPYVHPRVSIDLCASCDLGTRTNSELSLNFDAGLNFEVTPNFAVRVAAAFSGSELAGRQDAVAVGITWTPMALKKN